MGYCFSKNIFPLFVLPFVFPFVFIVSTIAQSWGQQETQFVPYRDFRSSSSHGLHVRHPESFAVPFF